MPAPDHCCRQLGRIDRAELWQDIGARVGLEVPVGLPVLPNPIKVIGDAVCDAVGTAAAVLSAIPVELCKPFAGPLLGLLEAQRRAAIGVERVIGCAEVAVMLPSCIV